MVETELTMQDIRQALNEVHAEQVPAEFIQTAVITTVKGDELYLSGQQFHDMVKNDKENVDPIIFEVQLAINVDQTISMISDLSQDIIEKAKEEVSWNDETNGSSE